METCRNVRLILSGRLVVLRSFFFSFLFFFFFFLYSYYYLNLLSSSRATPQAACLYQVLKQAFIHNGYNSHKTG